MQSSHPQPRIEMTNRVSSFPTVGARSMSVRTGVNPSGRATPQLRMSCQDGSSDLREARIAPSHPVVIQGPQDRRIPCRHCRGYIGKNRGPVCAVPGSGLLTGRPRRIPGSRAHISRAKSPGGLRPSRERIRCLSCGLRPPTYNGNWIPEEWGDGIQRS